MQVHYGDNQPWDTHSDNDSGHRKLCAKPDRHIAALLGDLKQRGLLEDTLVLWAASSVVQRCLKAATVEITVIGALGVDGVSQTSCRELSSAAKPSTAESPVNFP